MIALLLISFEVVVLGTIILLENRASTSPGDGLRNIQAWGIDLGVGMMMLPIFHDRGGAALIDGTALPFVIAFAIFLLLRDCAEFCFHYAQHKVPLLWRMHSLHHSDPNMSALTTNRHFWADQLIKSLTIWPLISLIISQNAAMVLTYAVVMGYNYFIHANLRVDFGRWSWLLNTPAYHRRHHSRLPEHYDTNFAAIFPIFDVICRTYRRPDGWPPTGLSRAPQSMRELLAWPRLTIDDEPTAATAPPVATQPGESTLRLS